MAKDEEEDDVLPDKDAAKGFYAKYEPKEILGRGISSTVRRCIEKETGIEFAAKIIDLGAATEAGDTNPYHMLEATRQEISILRQVMGHPYIIDLQDVFESDAFVFLVFELCPKGELFDYLTSVVTLSEKKTRTIMRQIFEGVEYIHAKNIVHRDLKPENILLDENHNVKITDFGFARQLKGDEKLTDLCGTPGYLAPETLKCNMFEGSPGYSKEVDIWACGVIMFTLLVGCPPFWHRKQMVMLRNIMEGKYSFTSPEWADISEDPKDLIRKCLVVDPAKRITVKEVLKHPFFNQMVLCSEPSTDGRTTYQLKSQNLRNSPSSGAQLYYNPNIIKTQTNYSYNKLPSTYASNNISNNNNRKSMTNLYLNKQASNQSNNSNNTYTTNATTSPSTTFPQAYNNNYNQRNYQSNGNAFDNTTAGPTTFLSTNQNNNSIGNATPTPTLFITQEQQQQQQQQQLLYQQQQQFIQKQQQTYEQQLRKQSRFNARKKFQFAILVIRAMIRIRRLRYTAEPLRVEEAIRDPYRVKVLRKVIDGCAFRVYGHWVKKGEGQNRAALFENTPRTELHALYINNLSR
ncbi:phosphorylase b kinase gamma catalytic chain, skeletal muscle/heart isoform isoform X1 [Bactrocera tryoni]|uniref:phosphorylase b kinase gamma catalytic chain, skeletal muscle/heart isoform isoform X1 n=1 Tax=Bactrocera tryoni TaxID=59916 RepID=UPI001A987174|nr:phosphorylase b kinase gamma catalytic chain, skeletal muscle/heart isoform isoform X1 [Bactrocera tryoni]XP_039962205.1 phosphorylase b kinase gamma catalytic chain, skeletal muscle/heart isoform isoform X1 [Bactrocera tryoni]XP_039962206.1 phosphorylase b kinase gamma catalytic chain, skeletal muscle/heart isoform isoform X1 [Bactrocera tryoni]XP_039962207.1 phosphorylase b kinase gamma catalytic chain, skeletal muscle/heart isoform isoform X1 [Bactrocera tryoni]XP_039962208.1 phosphorylas